MSLESREDLFLGEVVDLDGLVVATGENEVSVGGDVDGGDAGGLGGMVGGDGGGFGEGGEGFGGDVGRGSLSLFTGGREAERDEEKI